MHKLADEFGKRFIGEGYTRHIAQEDGVYDPALDDDAITHLEMLPKDVNFRFIEKRAMVLADTRTDMRVYTKDDKIQVLIPLNSEGESYYDIEGEGMMHIDTTSDEKAETMRSKFYYFNEDGSHATVNPDANPEDYPC